MCLFGSRCSVAFDGSGVSVASGVFGSGPCGAVFGVSEVPWLAGLDGSVASCAVHVALFY